MPSYLTITLDTSFLQPFKNGPVFWHTLYMLRFSSLACLAFLKRKNHHDPLEEYSTHW